MTHDQWTEVTVTQNGVNVTLYSTNSEGRPVVEEEFWQTHDELAAHTSPETVVLEAEGRPDDPQSDETASQEDYYIPRRGEIVRDKNAPEWAYEDTLKVVRVTDTPASEWYVSEYDATVAEVNEHFDETAPVVQATPNVESDDIDAVNVYAYPADRLERVDQSNN